MERRDDMDIFDITKTLGSTQRDSTPRFATVTGVHIKRLDVVLDGFTNTISVVRGCNPLVGSRVLLDKHDTTWIAVATINGGEGSTGCPYRVGDILQTVNPENPSVSWPGTTWEPCGQGRVLIGTGSNGTTNYATVGATGGTDGVVLTTNQMPSHTHRTGISPTASYGPGPAGNTTAQVSFSQTASPSEATGGGQSHENRMPYFTVYMWKRTT